MLNTIIVVLTCIFSFIAFSNKNLFNKTVFNPYIIKRNKQYYRFITHGFLHADWIHLLVNMFVLYIFGGVVEKIFVMMEGGIKGSIYFILIYFGSLICAVLPTYKKHQDDIYYNGVGASGAVSAIMVSYVIFQPMKDICLYGLICFPGIIWVIAYLGYSYFMGKKGKGNVNHEAHFWGAIFGLLFTIIFMPQSIHIFYEQIMRVL